MICNLVPKIYGKGVSIIIKTELEGSISGG